MIVALGIGTTVEREQTQHEGVDAAVGIGVAHGDVDAVAGARLRQRAEGRHQQAFVGEDYGGALRVGEPVGVARQQLTGIFTLQDSLGALHDVHLLVPNTEQRDASRLNLGELAAVLAQEETCLLHGVGIIVGIAIGEQMAYATAYVLADDAALTFGQGIEANEIEGVVLAAVGQRGYILRHMAVSHAAVGFTAGGEMFAQQTVVVVQRVVELQVVALEGAHVRILDIPLADSLQVV